MRGDDGEVVPPRLRRATGAGMILEGLATLAAAWIVLVGLAWTFQRKLVYFPMTRQVPPAEAFLEGGQDVTFDTEDGIRLGGWFLRGAGNDDGTAVVVFNGNAGDRSFRAPLAQALSRAGFSVLLFDYRGYGGNPGSPSEEGLMADARAARAYVAGRSDVDPARIVYFGESLGCAVAVGLATRHPPAALVLRSPFTSLVDVGQRHYPILPVRLLLKDRFSCIDQVASVACPLLVVAGEDDRLVPSSHSKRLYEAASEPRRYVLIPGAGHNDAELLDGERFVAEVVRFLEETANLGLRP